MNKQMNRYEKGVSVVAGSIITTAQEASDVFIYGLIDPRDIRIKYVGQTIDMARRYREHCEDVSGNAKSLWVRELKGKGLVPQMVQLEVVSRQSANYKENWWIQLLKNNGEVVTNTAKPTRDNNDFSGLLVDRVLEDSVVRQKILADFVGVAFSLHVFLVLVLGLMNYDNRYIAWIVIIMATLASLIVARLIVSRIPLHALRVPSPFSYRRLFLSIISWYRSMSIEEQEELKGTIVTVIGAPVIFAIIALTSGVPK